MQRSRRFWTPAAAEPMPDHQDIGTLYVLSNRDQSLAKIGLTRDSTPDARATAYERAHGIRWHVYWSAVTCNVAYAETAAHRALQDRRFSRVPEAQEIFHVTPGHAVRIAEQFVATPPGIAQQQQRQPHAGIPWLRYAEVAAAFAIAYWPVVHRLHRRLRATLQAGRN
jgi:hypothetical protein